MSNMTAVENIPGLTAHDRCDRCAAQAYVVVMTKGGMQLQFCAHHFTDNEDALLKDGHEVTVDEREKLVVRSGAEVS